MCTSNKAFNGKNIFYQSLYLDIYLIILRHLDVINPKIEDSSEYFNRSK